MKVFISQPMKGRTEKEILDQRKRIENCLLKGYKDVEILDSYVESAPDECNSVFFLGLSLQFLSQADLAVFCEGWETARGCIIERMVCRHYNISYMTITDEGLEFSESLEEGEEDG